MNQELYVIALTEEFGCFDEFVMVSTQEDFDKATKILDKLNDEWWEENDFAPTIEDVHKIFEENDIKYIKCKNWMSYGF